MSSGGYAASSSGCVTRPRAQIVVNQIDLTTLQLRTRQFRYDDNLTLRAVRASAGITLRPGNPVQNAFAESLNGRFRDECLNEHVFHDLAMARRIIEAWWLDYNACRPHSSLGGLVPKIGPARAGDKGDYSSSVCELLHTRVARYSAPIGFFGDETQPA